MLAKTRRRRVIHPFAWILGLIILLALILGIARPAYGCDPHQHGCNPHTGLAITTLSATVGWQIFALVTVLSIAAAGIILMILRRRYP